MVAGLLWLLDIQRAHVWQNYWFFCHFKPIYSPSTHFSDDYFLFHACLSCFILLFKKVSWHVSPVRAAVQLSRSFCHSWLPGLNNSSYFVKQSFSLVPHPNKRADPESYQQSSLPHPALLDCHCFPQRFIRAGGDVTFGFYLMKAVNNLWHHRLLLETQWGMHKTDLLGNPTKSICPVPVASTSDPTAYSGIKMKQELGIVYGKGFKLIASLQKAWNHFFGLPAVSVLWPGGHRHVVMSGQHFPHILNVFKIFNVSIWIFLGGLIVQI